MKNTALLIAAILLSATAAQAQSIAEIARFGDHTVALSNMPCPMNSSARTAIFTSYSAQRGNAIGCWTMNSTHVHVSWFRINTDRKPPVAVARASFESAED